MAESGRSPRRSQEVRAESASGPKNSADLGWSPLESGRSPAEFCRVRRGVESGGVEKVRSGLRSESGGVRAEFTTFRYNAYVAVKDAY